MNMKNDYRFGKKILLQFVAGIFGFSALFVAGCAICCGPYDYNYPAFGGTVQRSDPVHGRVGSIYSDPGPFGGPSSDSNLKPHDSGQNNSTFDGDEEDLEPLNGEDILTPPDLLEDNGSDNRNSDLLPPPADRIEQPRTPGPDESTSIRRLRNQSRRQRPVRQWR